MITALIFAGGILLRVLMFTSDKSMWGDEWFSMDLAQKPLQEVFLGAINDVHPPLYFLLLHGALRVLGEAEWVFRLVSFLPSLGLLAVIYFLAKEMLDIKAGRIALFLTAVSPYWLQASNEIRSYSLFAFATCLGTYFLVRAVKEPSTQKWGWAYLATAVLSVYIEHYAWFWLMATTVYVTHLFFKEKLPISVARFHRAALFLSAPSLILVVYQAIYREGVFNFERLKEYLPFWVLAKKAAGICWHFTCGYSYSMITVETVQAHLKSSSFFWFSFLTTLLALGAAFFGLTRLFRTRRSEFALFVTALVFPIAFLSLVYPIRLDARYLSFAAPFYFLLLAAGVSNLGRFPRVLFLTGFAIVNLWGSIQAIALPTDPIHKEDYLGMAAYVLEHSTSEDAVCGASPQFDYYRAKLKIDFKGDYFPNVEALAENHTRAYEKVWVMDGLNMHPEVSRKFYGRVHEKVVPLGYVPLGDPIRFGGEEGQTVLYLFVRSGESHV